jgi:hypothetical protein
MVDGELLFLTVTGTRPRQTRCKCGHRTAGTVYLLCPPHAAGCYLIFFFLHAPPLKYSTHHSRLVDSARRD